MAGTLRRYGLIGKSLQHSLSPFIHRRLMEAAGIKGEYKLYELEEGELDRQLPQLLAELDGFNCTLPYKQRIIPYLRELAPSARLYGAVNTVHQGVGHNTDGVGFRSCSVPMAGKKVCILGAGGVARVLAWEAARAGASEIVIRSRRLQQAQELAKALQAQGYDQVRGAGFGSREACEVLLNGTPLGMWPQVGALPVGEGELAGVSAVFDTIYNPTATRLVLKAKAQGIWARGGLQMLLEQAVAAQRIWNPEVDLGALQGELELLRRELAWQVLKVSPVKLVLCGFMGAGKTYIGERLARRLGVPFVDLDERISSHAQMSIADIFARWGEAAFRRLERECLEKELSQPGPLVLAAGGGAAIQPGAAELIHALGALVIYLDVPLEIALQRCGVSGGRPLLSQGVEAAAALYHRRRPLYAAAADLRVDAAGTEAEIIGTIFRAFELEV